MTHPTIIWQAQERQAAFIGCPVDDIAFGGARGGGKSDAVIGDWLAHENQYKEHAVGMAFRRERTELSELIERARQVFTPLGHSWKEQDKYFRGPNGGRLRFSYLENDNDADAYQGHILPAYHEAGHAVAGLVLGIEIKSASILSNDKSAGRVIAVGVDAAPVDHQVMVFYAGPFSQARVATDDGDPMFGWDRDFNEAAELLQTRNADRASIDALILVGRTQVLLDDHWPQIENVARALLEKESLTGTELREIVRRN